VASAADDLAHWAYDLEPTSEDLELADRSLLDTVAVAIAARDHPVLDVVAGMPQALIWSVAGHVLDFDDLHMESTTHVSVVCVPAVLAAGGGARDYLAAAGVMARIGNALGWPHYSAGWHATCTAGAPAAAVGAGMAMGLDREQLATAIALSVPAAGGVQRAFGTDAKSLQVGFATDAGLRAAHLAARGATADPTAVDSWLELLGGDASTLDLAGPAVPGGLAIKVYPCCYALQRPIDALAGLAGADLDPGDVERIVLRTPRGTVQPLIHHDPRTGLEGKFSIEYAAATALLDDYQGFASFTDDAVARPQARRLARLVETQLSEGGNWLLAGELEAEVHVGGAVLTTRSQYPPGSPQRPATPQEMRRKVDDCLAGTTVEAQALNWGSAADILRATL